jgi:hypothetical protein
VEGQCNENKPIPATFASNSVMNWSCLFNAHPFNLYIRTITDAGIGMAGVGLVEVDKRGILLLRPTSSVVVETS